MLTMRLHSIASLSLAAGAAAIVVDTGVYSYFLAVEGTITPAESSGLITAAYVFMAVLVAGMAAACYGTQRALAARRTAMAGLTSVAPTFWNLVPLLLSSKRYRRFFFAAVIAYGALYAFATSMVVYQPGVDFVQVYHASFPSVQVYPCCGLPLTVPTMTFYLANHVGLYFSPLDLLLLFTVTFLVGLNVALAAFARDCRTEGAAKYWLGGLGASIGLFTGCPACAGLFLAGSIGGAGAVAFASVLSFYQSEFIAATLPVLGLTLILVTRSLARRYKSGCPVPGSPQRPVGVLPD